MKRCSFILCIITFSLFLGACRVVNINSVDELMHSVWYVENEKRILDISGYAMLGKASIFLEKVNGDYNTLFGISPSKVYEKLQELGYKISDFELN